MKGHLEYNYDLRCLVAKLRLDDFDIKTLQHESGRVDIKFSFEGVRELLGLPSDLGLWIELEPEKR
jgi:hypothetical protein